MKKKSLKKLKKRIFALERQLKDGKIVTRQMAELWMKVLKKFADDFEISVPELNEVVSKFRDNL